MINSKIFFIFFIVSGTLADSNIKEKEIVLFEPAEKAIYLKSLISNKVKASFDLSFISLNNSKLIPSVGNKFISIVEHPSKGEWILNTESGEFIKYKNRYSTIFSGNDLFYFKYNKGGDTDLLVMETEGRKKDIYAFKKTSISPARELKKQKISWFFRREQVLVSVDLRTKKTSSINLDCRDAFIIDETERVFCMTETRGAEIRTKEGNIIRAIKEINSKFSINSVNLDNNEIILSKMVLSFNFKSFLREFHDLYKFNLNSFELSLIKKNAVSHGTSYFIK